MAELLNRIAFDEDKNNVFVENAEKGKNYFCPKCNGRLVYKNSGKTGPGSRRPHFAHHSDVNNCNPESILHSAFKIKAAELLKSGIENGDKIFLDWKCPSCGMQPQYNLLFSAVDVQLEYNLGDCRPDIALLNSEGKVVVALEIVVSHAPEENTLKYYHDNGIVLVQYNVTMADLIDIEEKLKHPDVVSLCLNNKCNNYNANAVMRVVGIQKRKCERCQQEYDVYGVLMRTPLGEYILSYMNTTDVQDIMKTNPNVILEVVPEQGGNKIILRSQCACPTQRLSWRVPVVPTINIGGYAGRSVHKSTNYNRKRSFYNKKRW